MLTYTSTRLWQEVVYVGYYLHWPLTEILELSHRDRERVIAEVGDINQAV